MLRFAVGFILDHAGNAAFAAETALLTSSSDAAEEFHTCFCVAGDVTVKVVLVTTSWPLMRRGTVYDVSGLTTVGLDMIASDRSGQAVEGRVEDLYLLFGGKLISGEVELIMACGNPECRAVFPAVRLRI